LLSFERAPPGLQRLLPRASPASAHCSRGLPPAGGRLALETLWSNKGGKQLTNGGQINGRARPARFAANAEAFTSKDMSPRRVIADSARSANWMLDWFATSIRGLGWTLGSAKTRTGGALRSGPMARPNDLLPRFTSLRDQGISDNTDSIQSVCLDRGGGADRTACIRGEATLDGPNWICPLCDGMTDGGGSCFAPC